MQYKWLNTKNNDKIIVFFNGWGMNESVVSHLKQCDYDILMFYDYTNLNTDFEFYSLNKYKEKYLVAWSMGVMVATLFNINYKSTTAINGTLLPINNEFGIPERIYKLTIRGFNELSAKKFIRNMFDNDSFQPNITRTIDELKQELIALTEYKANENFTYNNIIISKNDKIIPTRNQENYWKIKSNIKSGHCPFFEYENWNELL